MDLEILELRLGLKQFSTRCFNNFGGSRGTGDIDHIHDLPLAAR